MKTEPVRRHVKLIETVPIFQALFPNGRRFAFYPTQEETLSLNVFWEESDQGALKTYLEENAANFDSLFFDYCGRVVDERFLAFRNNAWFRRLDVNQSCYELGKKTFAAPELGALFGFWPLLSGGDPRRSSRLFALLPELFLRWGATVPIGGMNRIVDSMAQLFQEMGGEIRLNAAVQNIQIMNKRATGVRLRDGSIQQADIVISDVDTLTTYRELIDSDRTKYESVRLAQELLLYFFYAPYIHHYLYRLKIFQNSDHPKKLEFYLFQCLYMCFYGYQRRLS